MPKVSAKLQKGGVDIKELDTFVEKARREVGKRTAESSRSLKRLLTNEDYKRIYNDFVSGKVTRKFIKELSLEEEAVLRFYTTKEGYKNFNRALRGKIPITDFYISQKNLMNQALNKLPKYNKPVYRGLGKEGSKYFSSLKKGDKITEKSFLSSSLDEDVAELFMNRNNGNTILIMEHKSGVSIANISQSGFEGEILLKSDRTFIIENKTFKPRFDESDPLIQEIYLKEIE